MIQSGDFVELFEYEKEPVIRYSSRKKGKYTSAFQNFSGRRQSTLFACKRAFIRIVWANLRRANPPLFVTFTMFEVLPYKKCINAFTLFSKRLRSFFGSQFSYIVVPEFQKRGAVHFHMLLWDFPQDILKNERNNRLLQVCWAYGFVDCIATDGSGKLAGYLAKYMSKAMQNDRLVGKKAYMCSRNVLRPVLLPFQSIAGYAKDIWNIELSTDTPLQERRFETRWLGKGRYRLFKQ